MFNVDEIERIPYMAPGLVGPEKAARGKLPTDTWWHTIVPTNGSEKTGYPTQKPLGILRRIVQASTRPGALILDFFAGSGTTGAAALELGRRFILVDNNPEHPNRSHRGNPAANPTPEDIRTARKRAGLTQREAAALIYATQSAWEDWEQGRRRMHPGLWELFRLKVKESSA